MARTALPAAHVIGRDAETAAVDEFLEAAKTRFRVLSLEGEAGIGKTTVWREAIRRASEAGFYVIACRPGELETKLALAAVADLLEDVPDDAFAGLGAPQRRALEIALLRVEPGAVPLQPRLVAGGFRSLLQGMSDDRPVLVAVDDVQWLDAESAMAIQFALRRLVDRPVAWLFTRRFGEPARLLPEAVVAPESLTRMTLGPLTLAALHYVLVDRLAHPLTRPLLARVHRGSGGNPLYALEITRELGRDGDLLATPAGPVPADLRKLISRRVRQLPQATRDALLACAALSAPTTSLVDEVSLAPAEEGDIVRIDGTGRIAFCHPLYASAVYDSASRGRRRALHADLAERVHDLEERARHRALAATGSDERTAQALEDGATLSRLRGAWETAGELLEQAARLTPQDHGDHAERRRIAAAQHHIHAGDRPRARALLETTLAGPLPRALRAEALRLLAEISQNDENFDEARRLFAEALAHAEEPRLAAAMLLGLGYVHSNMFEHPRAREYAYAALEQAEASGGASLVGEALALCAMFDFLCGYGVDWENVERALALEDPNALVPLMRRPSTVAALLTLYLGRHTEGRERLTAVAESARERGDESDLAFILFWLSWLETQAANLGLAADAADEAAAVASLTGSPSTHAWVLTQQAWIAAHRGDAAMTRQACADAAELVERFGSKLAPLWIAASLGLLELSVGNAEAAWEACEPLVQATEIRGMAEPVTMFFLPEALEALISLGELDRAEPLLGLFERRGRDLDRTWALATAGRCRGLMHAAQGDHDAAAEAFERALREHERIELPFDRARVLLAKGAAERRARRRSQAKATLEEALREFERLGTPPFAERARDELSRIGLRPSTGNGLTPSERRIAELAADGLTNREIAAELFVSQKTVEASLGRAYRKLGIRSRAQLATHLSD